MTIVSAGTCSEKVNPIHSPCPTLHVSIDLKWIAIIEKIVF